MKSEGLNTFRNFIENYTKLSDDDWEIIRQIFEYRELQKNEIFLKEGEICRNFYFLEKGLIRFFILKDGNDITKTFTIPPYCFTSKTSFRHQTPALESMQAIEKTIVWQTTYKQLNQLVKLDSWNIFIRKLVNEVQEFSENLLLEVRTETAEERYQKLLNKYPVVIQKIPLKYMASFLGIAPQSLSRIRKKLHETRKS